jgi:hypothetical protein
MTQRVEPSEMGHRAEVLFTTIAKRRGWSVASAPREANIHEHWDFAIEQNGYRRKVEVKALKRAARGDEKMNEGWVWIELRNVRGEAGWLFGKSNWIAFETEAAFIIVDRHDLYQLVRRVVDRESKAKTARTAKYKVYTRKGRPDQIAQVRLDDILNIKIEEWGKFL